MATDHLRPICRVSLPLLMVVFTSVESVAIAQLDGFTDENAEVVDSIAGYVRLNDFVPDEMANGSGLSFDAAMRESEILPTKYQSDRRLVRPDARSRLPPSIGVRGDIAPKSRLDPPRLGVAAASRARLTAFERSRTRSRSIAC